MTRRAAHGSARERGAPVCHCERPAPERLRGRGPVPDADTRSQANPAGGRACTTRDAPTMTLASEDLMVNASSERGPGHRAGPTASTVHFAPDARKPVQRRTGAVGAAGPLVCHMPTCGTPPAAAPKPATPTPAAAAPTPAPASPPRNPPTMESPTSIPFAGSPSTVPPRPPTPQRSAQRWPRSGRSRAAPEPGLGRRGRRGLGERAGGRRRPRDGQGPLTAPPTAAASPAGPPPPRARAQAGRAGRGRPARGARTSCPAARGP